MTTNVCPSCEGRCGHEEILEPPKDGQGQPISYAWWGCDACDQTGHIGAPARRVAMIVDSHVADASTQARKQAAPGGAR